MPVAVECCNGLLGHCPITCGRIQIRVDWARLHVADRDAVHNTPDGTQILCPAEAGAAHRQIAAEYGDQAGAVVSEAQTRRKSKSRQNSPVSFGMQYDVWGPASPKSVELHN